MPDMFYLYKMKSALKQKKTDVTLSDRELRLVKMVCAEKLNREIAETLGTSLRTVEKIRKRVYEKTGAGSSIGLFKWALRNGIYRLKL